VRPRRESKARCSGCNQPSAGYDQLALRRFEFIPLWGFVVVFEAGLPGYAATLWFGLAAPAGTPKEIVARLQSESANALAAADIKQRFVSQGANVIGSTPEQFAQFIGNELKKWASVTKAAGIKTKF